MATTLSLTPEQREVQASIITEVFDLKDASRVSENWSMESYGGGAFVRIELVEFVDLETVNALMNGRRKP